eukprot:CAMPEP_0182928338 /NCGR_PEP_ID=MMETSP0105_2-20130417/15536_1 /TAXON_ID=81532 ORGANISM="Acanthoeca-like sp., Strain 10tr" /NCGR_SAMPLE_ID=MMETSP0105_2 /ASSEMBLY_ACC=CAM_ASM_000205 /LENGTH=33 /DNA_ID= /DNA_START= /DNA_END= /DNA_ORIENTATION=
MRGLDPDFDMAAIRHIATSPPSPIIAPCFARGS